MDTNINNPKISVIIPTCNRPELLYQAVQSILNQSFQNFEIIVVDDGLEKRADKIIEKINDDRIVYIKHEKNKGASAARNTGIKKARGEYLILLDDDDTSFQKRLKIQNKFMDKNSKIGVAGSWAQIIEKTRSKKYIKPISNPKKIKTMLLFGCPIINPSVIFRRKLLNKYNLEYITKLKLSEDYA